MVEIGRSSMAQNIAMYYKRTSIDTDDKWKDATRIPQKDEIILVQSDIMNADPSGFGIKIGDGETPYSNLPYFIKDSSKDIAAINNIISDITEKLDILYIDNHELRTKLKYLFITNILSIIAAISFIVYII